MIDVIPDPPSQWRTQQRRAAVLGSPVEHSLSPVLHNAAYHALEIPWSYTRREVQIVDLADVLTDATSVDVGFSVTMPLKKEALRLSDAATERAERAGGANTLVRRDGGWFADNTDIHGVAAAVWSALAAGERVNNLTILGAGSTAGAVALACKTLGVATVNVCARRPEQAAEVQALVEADGLIATYVPWDDAASVLHADVVVSTVVAGAADHLASVVPVNARILLDVVYAPWPSALAAAWQARKGEVVPGTRMLLHQAVEQVRLMTGLEGPVHSMRSALESVGAPV